MSSDKHKRAIGIFPNRPATASALQALRDAGFSVHDITVITRDGSEEGAIAGIQVQDSEGNSAQAGAKKGAFTGGVFGSLVGALVGIGALTIPGVAPAVVLGEAAAVLVSIVAGGAVGAAAGGLVGALIGLGVPRNRAKAYSDRVNKGEYLVMLRGTDRGLQRAEEILNRHGVGDWGVYDTHDRLATKAAVGRPVASHPGIGRNEPSVASVPVATPDRPIGEDYRSDRQVDRPVQQVTDHMEYVTPLESSRPLDGNYREVERVESHPVRGDIGHPGVAPVHPSDRQLDHDERDHYRIDDRIPPSAANNVGYVTPVTPVNPVNPVVNDSYHTDYREADRVVDRTVVNEGQYVSRDDVRRYPEEYDRVDRPMSAQPDEYRGGIHPSVEPGRVDTVPSTGMAGSVPLQRSEKRSIGVFPNQYAMERALEALRQSGFPMHKVSIIVRDHENSPNLTESAMGSASQGDSPVSAMGRYTGFLVGSNRFDAPGVGPILVMGSEAGAFSDAFADKKVGIFPTDFVETLGRLGIPQVQARIYRDRLAHDGCLVMVRGTGDEALKATSALNQSGIQDWGVYSV
ncbi:hypothetical protein IQ268_21420 [Oculatella sp. LEGE 06141]|uniref:general stress protein n=1 Tax=Oculatella sp. LEGE 06141 TaxID=1828648 RepID=UPI001881D096|nr:general stress protein [Oculatella sp. LEGE 06141]MBE9181125.1 hypothetical protein [Oculatella sp. LEGE 06141]